MENGLRAVIAAVDPAPLEEAARLAGFHPAGRAGDADGALMLLRRAQPDLLLADAVLPGMDGPALAQAARELPLWVHPAVILAVPGGFMLPGAEALSTLDAAILEKPVPAEGLRAAFEELRRREPVLPGEKALRLQALLEELGVPEHPGRRALSTAAALAWRDGRCLSDRKRRLWPDVARWTGMTGAQAERAMRYAIDAAWRTGAIEAQNRIFGDTIDARRGRPTCGEMIARLADILRWEGNI